MKIALIGHGKMGQAIEKIARGRGHEIVAIIDVNNINAIDNLKKSSPDVAIEFTTPATAVDNYHRLIAQGIPVVSGTTGWAEHMPEVKALVESTPGASMLWASNFSVGVNIFFALDKWLAAVMAHCPDYKPTIKEIHHVHKLDHPSGTAITLAERLNEALPAGDARAVTNDVIEWERIDETPGTHIVTWTSHVDRIMIEHEAFGRESFALGAVMAAEWLPGHPGMNDISAVMAGILGDH